MLLIAGEKKFGSGVVIRQILKNKTFCLISTNGMFLSLLRLPYLVYKNKIIYFQPSIYGSSVLRDFAIYLLLICLNKKFNIILLCDVNASRFRFLAFNILNSSNCICIYSASKLNSCIKTKSVIFRQLSEKPASYKVSSKLPLTLVYGNYLSKAKGLANFLKCIDDLRLGDYLIYGSSNNSDVDLENYQCYRTLSISEFEGFFHTDVYAKFSNHVYFFGSYLDLSPLVVENAIINGLPIVVYKNQRAAKILDNFIGPDGYLDISDCSSLCHIDRAQLVASWTSACSVLSSRWPLNEVLK